MKSHSFISSTTRSAVICLLLVIMAFPGRVAAAPAAKLPAVVKIGVIYPDYPYTGLLTSWGHEGLSFLDQARLDINTLAPGITFDLVIRPTDGTSAMALSAAQDLVINEGVQAIVGLPTSPELAGAINFIRNHHIAVISSTSTGSAPDLRQVDTIYRAMPNELYLARNMADMVMTQGYNRVAVIHSTNDWGRDYSDELMNRLLARGCAVESVAVQPLPPSTANYAVEVRELADKVGFLGTGPRTTVVMVMGEGDDLIVLNHALAFSTLHVPWFSALAGPELLTGTYAGLYLPNGSNLAYSVGLQSQEYYFPRGGSADALSMQAQTILGTKPRAEHVYVYDAVQLMAHAILLAGTYNGAAIAAQIPQAALSYPAATGPIHFDPNGDRDSGDLAYTCMVPAGSLYQYAYCAFFHGDAVSGFFDILPVSQPRDLEWLR